MVKWAAKFLHTDQIYLWHEHLMKLAIEYKSSVLAQTPDASLEVKVPFSNLSAQGLSLTVVVKGA